jgi:hypothetical protein
LWFEESSPFLARLSAELGDIPHTIKPLLWSGENSIHVRDKTAHTLAKSLSVEHTEHPQAAQLIIAHSHGGNIALRALHHLQMRDGSQHRNDGVDPFVVTLATPFVEIQEADFGYRPLLVRVTLMLVMMLLSMSLAAVFLEFILGFLFSPISDAYVSPIFMMTLVVAGLGTGVPMGRWWIVRKAAARRNQVNALKDATRLGELLSAQRLLVIRAIDDEASLALALGTIFNYVTAGFITFTFWLFLALPSLIGIINLIWEPRLLSWNYFTSHLVFLGSSWNRVGKFQGLKGQKAL